jgi:hypothetical protein
MQSVPFHGFLAMRLAPPVFGGPAMKNSPENRASPIGMGGF